MSTRKQKAQKQRRLGRNASIHNIDDRPTIDKEDHQPSLANTNERLAAYEESKKRSAALGKRIQALIGRIEKMQESESTTPEMREMGRDMLRVMVQMSEVEMSSMDLANAEMEVSTKALDEYENLCNIHASLEQKWKRTELSCANLQKELVELRAQQTEHKKLHLSVVNERDEARRQLKQLEGQKKDALQQSAKQRRENTSLKNQQVTQEKEIARLELCETRPCPICFEDRQPCALVPCGHTGCRECLSHLPHCHICRAQTALIIDLHMLTLLRKANDIVYRVDLSD